MKSTSLAALQGKRVLLTGASGALGMELRQIFAGSSSSLLSTARDGSGAEHLDVLDGDQVRRCFADFKPDVVIHLAAIVPIPQIEKDHGRAFMVNVVGLDNVLKEFEASGRPGRVVVVSSSEVYGNGTPGRKFVESDRFSPNNFYAYTKVAQEELAGLYVKRGVDIKIARVFNYSSTYKKPVYSLESFASQIASIVKGGGKREIVVGNLEPERDFIQGYDAAEALLAIANDATPALAFNVSRGETVSMRRLLEMMIREFGADVEIVVDRAKYRTIDNLYVCGDNTLLRNTGWTVSMSVEEMIARLVRHHRSGPGQ